MFLFICNLQAGVALKTKELSKLAAHISIHCMKRIALEHLNFEMVELKNLQAETNDSWEFNYEILHKWYNKSSDNSRSVSTSTVLKLDRSIIHTHNIKPIHNIA